MEKRWLLATLTVLVLLSAPPLRADIWDVATNSDDSYATCNQLDHGSVQVHDLGVRPGPVADEDWYILAVLPFTSWEAVIDGNTGDLWSSFTFKRFGEDHTTLLQDGAFSGYGMGYARWMAWQGDSVQRWAYLRVGDASCGTSCTSDDQYRIQLSETTIAVPRYNNTAGQVTVLICQNTWWWDSAHGRVNIWVEGTGGVNTVPAAAFTFTIPGHGVASWNLSTVTGATNTKGALTITHDARNGALVCKAVAIEPATGFSFDSPGLTKPR